MKKTLSITALLLGLSGLFWISSCDGCRETLDKFIREAMIPIPKADRTPPKIWFEVTDTKTNTTQTFTSDTDLIKSNGDHLKIVLWGEDADGGIKKLCLAHSFPVHLLQHLRLAAGMLHHANAWRESVSGLLRSDHPSVQKMVYPG
ncbi:MAG: hypothetical protein IPH12_17985 [Saprospirales bacterium]|nr:hypothetical protein [Saprospirales bacterium]